jgi:uncharacterized lipoprotein
MQTLIIIVVVQLAVTLLSGCSQLDNKMAQQKNISQNLTCQPVDATGCIGWTK